MTVGEFRTHNVVVPPTDLPDDSDAEWTGDDGWAEPAPGTFPGREHTRTADTELTPEEHEWSEQLISVLAQSAVAARSEGPSRHQPRVRMLRSAAEDPMRRRNFPRSSGRFIPAEVVAARERAEDDRRRREEDERYHDFRRRLFGRDAPEPVTTPAPPTDRRDRRRQRDSRARPANPTGDLSPRSFAQDTER